MEQAKQRLQLAGRQARYTANSLGTTLAEDSPDIEQVRYTLAVFKEEIVEVSNRQGDLVTHMTAEELEAEVDNLVHFKNSLSEAASKAQSWIARQDINSRVASSVSSNSGNLLSRMKLPDIKLPTFGGDLLKWTQYWDQMQAGIFSNPNLADVDKFTYLRSSLTGDALNLIAGINMTADSFTDACDLLKTEYAKPDKLEACHFIDLLEMRPPVKRAGSDKLDYKSLKDFKNKIVRNVRNLGTIGVQTREYERMALQLFFSLLPPEFRAKWYARYANRDMSQFLEFLEAQLTSLERVIIKGLIRVH